MGKRCAVCRHKDLTKIDAALVGGEPVLKLARRVNLKTDALYRHQAIHLPQTLLKANDIEQVARADDLLELLKKLIRYANEYMKKAAEKEDYRTSLAGIREQTRIIALLAELDGRITRAPQFNVLMSSEWVKIRTISMKALEPYPEARRALARALLDAGATE